MNYAQIDKDGIVTGISFLSGKVNLEEMIPIKEDATISIGQKFIKLDGNGLGKFQFIEQDKNSAIEPTTEDILAEILLQTTYTNCLLETGL